MEVYSVDSFGVANEVPKEVLKKWNALVVKSNQLIESIRDNCTTTELKIINFLISQVKPESELANGKNLPLGFKEFKQLCNIKGKNLQWFKLNCQKLFDKCFWIKDSQNNTETLYHYFHKIKIDYRKETVYFDFEEEIMPFVSHLQKNFTRYPLQFTLLMKSKYSIRLYELLKDLKKGYQGKQVIAVDIQGLRETLGVPETMRYQDFKRYVLDPACCEINSIEQLGIYKNINNLNELKEIESVRSGEINVYSDLIVSYRPRKNYSRSYNLIEFYIEEKPKQMISEIKKVNEQYLSDELKKPNSYYKRPNRCAYQVALDIFNRDEEVQMDE